ncbi:hypothetical protein CRYUN_Cryun07bG0080400 [Craigia yunnanensis]
MDAFFVLSNSPFSITSILFFLIFFQVSYANDDIHFSSCSPFDCGNLENISYPFWTDYLDRPAYCGFGYEEYKLKCTQNTPPVMTISSQEFQLVHLNQSRGLITIQRVEFGKNTCPEEILINNIFNYSDTAENITLFYNCQSGDHSFTCKKEGSEGFTMFFKNDGDKCGAEKVEIPVGSKALDELKRGITALNETLVQPFDMKYFAYDEYCRQCKDSGGRCGSNKDLPAAFVCYCPDRPHQLIKCEPGMLASVFHSLLTLSE